MKKTYISATCGADFSHERDQFLRSSADSWELWDRLSASECPACYAARRAAEQAQHPLMLRMDDYMGGLDEQFVLFFDGDTLPHKDDIKSLGYKWSIAGEYACSAYTFERGARRWVKTVSQEAVYDEIERAKAIGAAIDREIFERLED